MSVGKSTLFEIFAPAGESYRLFAYSFAYRFVKIRDSLAERAPSSPTMTSWRFFSFGWNSLLWRFSDRR